MQSVTEFVMDKDRPGYQGSTSLRVQFEFYAEHLASDEEQESNSHDSLNDTVVDALAMWERTGRPTQVRIALEVDGEGRYIEQYCLMRM